MNKQAILKNGRAYMKSFAALSRDARYVFTLFLGLILFLFTLIQTIDTGLFDSFERPLFNSINSWPAFFYPLFFAATQFGGMGGLAAWFIGGWAAVNRRAAVTSVSAGIVGWFAAKLVKDMIERGRPVVCSKTFSCGENSSGAMGFLQVTQPLLPLAQQFCIFKLNQNIVNI